MTRSRPDLMALLDVILLVFFAMTLSKDRQHKKAQHSLKQELVSEQKKHRTKMDEISSLVSQLRRLVSQMHGASSSKPLSGKPVPLQLSRVQRQLQAGIQQWKTKEASLHQSNRNLRRLSTQASQEIKSKEQELRKLNELLLRSNLKLEQMTASKMRVEAELKLLRKNRNQLLQDIAKLNQKLRQATGLETQIQQENKKLLVSLKELKSQNQKLLESKRYLEEQIKRLKKNVTSLRQAERKKNKGRVELVKSMEALRVRGEKDRLRYLKLSTQHKLLKEAHQALVKKVEAFTKESTLLRRSVIQLKAESSFLSKSNQTMTRQLQTKGLALEKLRLEMKSAQSNWRKEKATWKLKKSQLQAKNQRLAESRKQLEDALKMVQRWGQMNGREKSGLTKSLARYFQAVMIYVKGDRIVGYRRFPAKTMKSFSRPVELSRRASNGVNLYYRGKVEKDFRAFEVLERKLPGELASSLEVIYIFVFDDNSSKATAQGLEQEHLKHYRGRRVIWQL